MRPKAAADNKAAAGNIAWRLRAPACPALFYVNIDLRLWPRERESIV